MVIFMGMRHGLIIGMGKIHDISLWVFHELFPASIAAEIDTLSFVVYEDGWVNWFIHSYGAQGIGHLIVSGRGLIFHRVVIVAT